MQHKAHKPANYISEPQTIDECIQNATFQLQNVIGWMSKMDFENSFSKAQCLVKDLKLTIEMQTGNFSKGVVCDTAGYKKSTKQEFDAAKEKAKQ